MRQTPPEAAQLLAWYDRHARRLPWRVGPAERAAGVMPDPYRVWLSEVMLQQTTVAAVKSYFETFTRRWPSVEALAAAPEADVMAAWAGLGYYARARNLVACARAVTARGGVFPGNAAGLRDLPGIGDYTSAAIAAIAYDEPVAVVDGNVERVVSRLAALETPLPAARPAIRHRMADLTPAHRPGDFAQAMMDLGATICTPRRPACGICPVMEGCAARDGGDPERFPIKAPKAAKPHRVGAAYVAERVRDGAILLRQRPGKGLLGGMAEPPMTGWTARQDGATDLSQAPFPAPWRIAGAVEHSFTHFHLTLTVWHAEVGDAPAGEGWWEPVETIEGAALPTLMRKCLARALA
ncbi:A/G-specific adenine glycosylase [Aureimonas frigidaquae]|uniref:A/G-specific adenine glycosylase n=1 Tax=Aureimonas frigidaquae TaxID=424757 RepID=UPI0007841744|nr:A/G-specific adenine glycosylase [Aureimonas frigidaquae]